MPRPSFGLLDQVKTGWTAPKRIQFAGRWIDRTAVDVSNNSIWHYECYIGKLRVAFSVYYTAKPLGRQIKNARPMWQAGVFSTIPPQFSFSTGHHETFDACADDLRAKIKRARSRLLKCL